MLKAIRELLVGTREVPAKNNIASQPSSPTEPAGYFMPQSATQLLDIPARKQCLQQLWENSALPKDLYDQFYLQPLHKLVTLMQALPATRQGEYASEGGLVDITLQTTTYAVRLAKGYMLPPGAAPEEQAAQNVQWNMVVFYAALWHYLPLFSQLEGELQSGQPWWVGVAIPTEPYRFRFAATPLAPALASCQSTMIAARLLPVAVSDWLSALPAAIQSLMLIASRQPSALPVIDDIVQEAVRLAHGEDLLAGLQRGGGVTPAASLTPMVPATEKEPLSPPVPSIDLQGVVSSQPTEGQAVTDELKTPFGEDFASTTEVLLSSALDMPVNDKLLAEMAIVPEPVVGTGEDIQALLSLMDVSVSAPVEEVEQSEGDAPQKACSLPEDNPRPAQTALSLPETVPDIQSHDFPANDRRQEQPGEPFWQWLCSGLRSGDVAVNTGEARVHIVSGFVFLCVPDIFHLYIKQMDRKTDTRNALQRDFEKMGKHRISKGQRFFIGHLYQSTVGMGSYRRINGYLIKANDLFDRASVPADSLLLMMP
ncbi:TraI domain-containing protein [Serratia marcescens]|nr:TraI domain-containing protein [Serratia marcescens]ELQ9442456.1 TraI domain-containing protein [Serratia marcescens]ELT5563222.1 TraI domain-containing protein [Serratia marcescens]